MSLVAILAALSPHPKISFLADAKCHMLTSYTTKSFIAVKDQGRAQVEVPQIYTIVQCMPVEADGRLRYRIKSDKIERVATEDELSYCQ